MERPIPRRDFLGYGLASPILASLPRPSGRDVRAFQLIERAGLRRFGYPVQTVVPDAVDGRNFRLLLDGRAIPAQFRVVEVEPGRRELVLDFAASPEPLEARRYEVIFGPEIEPGPEPQAGLTVEGFDEHFAVKQASGLTFEFAKRPEDFLQNVGSPRLGYLRGDLGGLTIVERDEKSPRSRLNTDFTARVTREGPGAVGLRYEWFGPSGQRSTLDLSIPQSKSWVQASWSVADPGERISALAVALNLKIEGRPTLVDFGAGSTIYGQIQGPERMELAAGQGPGLAGGWVVRQGQGQVPLVQAASTVETPRPAEGWAHVMDSRRCTAVAVAGFGRGVARDTIAIEADGRLKVSREFLGPQPGVASAPKRLDFWLHFVPMPVQVGAATSPQAILAPLEVEWDR